MAARNALRPILPAGVVLPLFASALFTGAVLIFWVEPMFTKMVLPLFGGSPSVWNTAVMFFQAALLAGYGYAHLLAKLRSVRLQALLHVGVLSIAAMALPIAAAPGWVASPEASPVLSLLALLTISLGLPFFAVAATAPLLQRWFAMSGHATASDPYFLYGASNLGSIIALLGYPVLIEPHLRLGDQSSAWAAGYVTLLILIGLSALSIWHVPARRTDTTGVDHSAAPVTWGRRLHWMLLALVPSSLLLGVTLHISTDIASIPLLWIVPLTLYLLSFVLVFARRPILRHAWMTAIQPFIVLPIVALFWFNLPVRVELPLHLAAFFICAMVCHGELSRLRPGVGSLTEYYLWISVGGFLGGAFNVLVAPVLFNAVYEYPIALALACALRPWPAGSPRKLTWSNLILPLLFLATVPLRLLGRQIHVDIPGAAGAFFYVLPIIGVAHMRRRQPIEWGLGVAAALAVLHLMIVAPGTIELKRSFFGVYKVKQVVNDRYTVLIHGTTVHGAQSTDENERREPQTYYLKAGPLGQLFAAANEEGRLRSVGVVGLGIGTTACFRRSGQSWTFFEIDPLIERIARDQRYFHFLSDCLGDGQIILGDGRLSLAAQPDGAFDLLVLDAFSSDAIPIHLLTREAMALYFEKLSPDGVIAVHISNRLLNLEPVVANIAADLGVTAIGQSYFPDAEIKANHYATPSRWILLARKPDALSAFAQDPRWIALAPRPQYSLWTDDFSNILEIYRWR